MTSVFAKILCELEKGHSVVLATVIQKSGSAPAGAGSQMLVGLLGRILGTVGGGALEYQTQQMAARLLAEQRSLCHLFRLHPNEEDDIGMACGGDATVWMQYISCTDPVWPQVTAKLLQQIRSHRRGHLVLHLNGAAPSLLDENGTVIAGSPILSPVPFSAQGAVQTSAYFSMPLPIGERVIIFGGGHCAQALAPLLHTVGFRVTVMEQRPEFASKDLFPMAEAVICGNYQRITDHLTLTPEDYLVVMTNGHSHDYEVQEQALRYPLAYIGVIGSRKKTAAVNERLRQAGISEDAISSVHTPIGTAIKAVTPQEIAVSIAGEMIYERALRREAAGYTAHGCPMH